MPPPRPWLAAAIVVLVAAGVGFWAERSPFAGWSVDQSITLRHLFFGDRHEIAQSPVVVLAIDEPTFEHPAFRDTPMAFWGPQLGQVLGALDNAGARMIGLDFIPSTTAETIAPGHDRPFIESVQRLASTGRLVMARADFAGRSIEPHPIFAFVAGGKNIRSVNVSPDGDGIVRRIPLWLRSTDGAPVATFATEIASRSGAAIGPPIVGLSHFVNFTDRAMVPTYSMADVTSCIQAGDATTLRQAFAERIVLLGATLDIEDRKSVSARAYIDPAIGRQQLDCVKSGSQSIEPRRSALPGVYILAQSINDLMRGEALQPAPPWIVGVLVIVLAAIGGAIGWCFGALKGGILSVTLVLAWIATAGIVAQSDRILPMIGGSLALIGGFAGVFGFRALLVEREKRRLAHALGRYLDEKVAFALLSGAQPIELGGELREITVWFSDIAGFSTISEGAAPKELVRRLNQHFSVLGEAIEAEGGIIDKFVGDAVVAVFGAPGRQPDHAARALRAARNAMRKLRDNPGAAGGFEVRIGINTGTALVGNVGSNRRFDYTAIGDTVNIAQRLEAANKEHGTSILVSADTANAAGVGFALRPVGAINVKGRASQVIALELLLDGAIRSDK